MSEPYTCEECAAKNVSRDANCWRCNAPPPPALDLFDDLFGTDTEGSAEQ